MVARNTNISRFQANYLFPEIGRRKQQLLAQQPHAKIISLGVGDTTQPLPTSASKGMADLAIRLCTQDGYRGYGPEQGDEQLRQRIVDAYYTDLIHSDELFIGDGAKCDLARLQLLFGSEVNIAVQDPAYPVYLDNAVLVGASGTYSAQSSGYTNIRYLSCHPENNFFPDLDGAKGCDLLFFCSPNNPTGHVSSHHQLEQLVRFAHEENAIIIYDAAYAAFIQDPTLPKSIYEIEGAREVAIELGSFSKLAGFTGVRLGWTIVPRELCYEGKEQVINDWRRVISTTFNGASLLAQAGGLAVLEPAALSQIDQLIHYYLENAKILKEALQDLGLPSYGGDNAPYLWVPLDGRNSWDVFDKLLTQAHLVTTPGAGFGPGGESYLRLSALGSRSDIQEAVPRLSHLTS